MQGLVESGTEPDNESPRSSVNRLNCTPNHHSYQTALLDTVSTNSDIVLDERGLISSGSDDALELGLANHLNCGQSSNSLGEVPSNVDNFIAEYILGTAEATRATTLKRNKSPLSGDLSVMLRETILSPHGSQGKTLYHFHTTDIPGPLTCEQAERIVDFHADQIAWMHNTIYSPSFKKECQDYWHMPREFEGTAWLALYNAVMCIGLCHMSDDEHTQLGISRAGEMIKWFYGEIRTSLDSADYTAVHSSMFTCLILNESI